ncbi:hypothetical protein Nepgr_007744 [Nepenthes gracilis]|uniref:WRKY domain-containing protein n=1 Tax=Nepenthes gracilis TaxID=150966 RepID=A0AAD3S7U6_NEPGR|nr:hypothetical protein Nepgr_007744 [Nepenthes gracilis]
MCIPLSKIHQHFNYGVSFLDSSTVSLFPCLFTPDVSIIRVAAQVLNCHVWDWRKYHSPTSPMESPRNGDNEQLLLGSKDMRSCTEDDKDKNISVGVSGDILSVTRSFSQQKFSSRGGLVERIAARTGFNAPRLNTESIRSSDITMNKTEACSPYLTIPPGLSPTMLLESPVLLTNSMVQQSPTTGKFPLFANDNSKSTMLSRDTFEKCKDSVLDDVNAPFSFRPVVDSGSSFISRAAKNLTAAAYMQHPVAIVEGSVQSDDAFQSAEQCKVHARNSSSVQVQVELSSSSINKDTGNYAIKSDQKASDTFCDGGADHSAPVDENQDVEGEQRGGEDSISGGSGSGNSCSGPSDDGYNWRKYGQKQVKGSEYPRSYYKCTHPNCPVKKKVERSQECHITEIIYKGAHNHPKPPPGRRPAIGSTNQLDDMLLDVNEQGGTQTGLDGNPVWTSLQKVADGAASDWRNDNLEVTSSISGGPDFCNPSTFLQPQNGQCCEAGDAVDVSSTFNEDDEDDRGTHGSVSLGYDGEGDEFESKRRKIEAYATELGGATRAIREPRVVVQTTSEVDILDDGYRWRKYGQKVVKGNPNPRSYYKCTHAGCTVRKHVERASHDLKSVITTYEGKHNHDVPAARNSSHANAKSSTNHIIAETEAVPRRPEPSQVPNSIARFEVPAAASLGSFGIQARQHLGPSHSFPFGVSQPSLANLAMAGPRFGSNLAKLPVLSASYVGQQHRQVSQVGYSLPREEPKVEPVVSEPVPPNLSNRPSLYHHMMGM